MTRVGSEDVQKTMGPLMEMARIQSEINRLFDNLLDLEDQPGGAGSWMPNADILETEDTLVLKVEIPGVAPDKLCLSVHGGNVILRGEKARPSAEGAVEFHTAERQFGRFKRVIQLGVPVNTRLATAELSNGLLEVRFPKVPNRRGEEVPIEITGK
ncbi:MAG: Hsp20/alpha crystallin family protein [Acidobacteria bacterium]|nr:MAG: Hsp20/alpha crystallin family protein [Acidobacteriota bacterium]